MILRAIEESGLPTVCIVNMHDRAERVGMPRAVSVKFPRGATLGPPHQPDVHREVILDALDWLQNARQSDRYRELEHRWSQDAAHDDVKAQTGAKAG